MSEGIFAADQVGVPESWGGVIANIDKGSCPLTSMAKEAKKPSAALDNWQAEKYLAPKHTPVVDGEDVKKYEDVSGRKKIQGRAQKIWRNPKTSDFAENVNEVDGLNGSEQADQIAKALVLVKRGMEARCLSNIDSQEDDGVKGHGTRGAFKWASSTAQDDLPVPAEFRTPTGSNYSGTLADFSVEKDWRDISSNMAIQRKGAGTVHGFVGINLKKRFTNSTIYSPNETGYTAIRSTNQAGDNGVLEYTTDVVKDEGGTMILHPSFFLLTTEDGADTAATHNSGIFIDMDMISLAFNRKPRVDPKQDDGGGARAIVDAIFCLRCYNPLGLGSVICNS